MTEVPKSDITEEVDAIASARQVFRLALIRSHENRRNIGEVEAAAARFCEALHRAGHTPEGTLIDAKKVIEDAIDGDDVPVAERAVTSCIQHYFRPGEGRTN
jgi:hypothetical protein